MDNEFDEQMKVNLICVAVIICTVILMFMEILSFIISDIDTQDSVHLTEAILEACVAMLLIPCAYKIVNGNKKAWICAAIIIVLQLIAVIITDFPLKWVGVVFIIIIAVLLLLPRTMRHCNIIKN